MPISAMGANFVVGGGLKIIGFDSCFAQRLITHGSTVDQF